MVGLLVLDAFSIVPNAVSSLLSASSVVLRALGSVLAQRRFALAPGAWAFAADTSCTSSTTVNGCSSNLLAVTETSIPEYDSPSRTDSRGRYV